MNKNVTFAAAGVVGLATLLMPVASMARDLTVVSWGGNYQDAQREDLLQAVCRCVGQAGAR